MEYYIAAGTHRRGPFTLEQLKGEELGPETLIWKTGLSGWLRADALPETQELLKELPPPLTAESAPLPAAIPVDQPAAPWNPVAIAWLGVVFTPIWSGILAAVNAHRLNRRSPWWRPVGLGLGWLGAAFLLGRFTDSYLAALGLYVVAAWLIYAVELRSQQILYRAGAWPTARIRTWLLPLLVSSPLAVLVFLGFVVSPLLPLEPRDVCQRFLGATKEAEMKKYTTLNLWPVLPALAKPDTSGDKWDLELTDETDAPADVGGHLVGLRAAGKYNGERMQSTGLFHLVQRDNEWKIEEIYFTAINGQSLENWLAVSRDFPRIEEPSPNSPVTPSPPPPSAGTKPKPVADQSLAKSGAPYRGLAMAAGRLFHERGGKAVMGILAAIGLAFARLFGHGSDKKDERAAVT